MIDLRASTEGFTADLEAVRGSIDGSLIDSFDRAGATLERGLLSALRRGSLGFDDLKRLAFRAFDEIASHALQSGFGDLFGGSGGGLGGFLVQSFGALLGLPGRATGGPVSPGRGFLVGESGPEIFIPTSSGRIESERVGGSGGRDVRVAIQLNTPPETAAPTAMRRSSRQLASAVRRAIEQT
ncbi:tail tape measure protein [Erythrobacter sp.]|uniref:tail tape measure protein n=1 Tax=Erythrobacter sp. TaxID=1042 RepID=UPI00345C2146